MSIVLEINGLSKHYGSIQALKSVSLTIPKGTVYGILGPNGSGKTTLALLLTGLYQPEGGDLQLQRIANVLHAHALDRQVAFVTRTLRVGDVEGVGEVGHGRAKHASVCPPTPSHGLLDTIRTA